MLDFTKMQGLGNDFIVVDGPLELTAAQVSILCDRRTGIGADGVLIVTPGEPIVMGYLNADGSAAEMCGNGLRCVARYAVDHALVTEQQFVVSTPAGPRRVDVRESVIRVELGETSVTGHTTIDGIRYHLIDVGNPHAVAVVDDPQSTDVATIGARVETDDQFVNGTNVEFASIAEDLIELRVWERGVGETMACGTGMAAATVVASRMGKIDSQARVRVPGGEGIVELEGSVAWLSGPAEYSFRGQTDLVDQVRDNA